MSFDRWSAFALILLLGILTATSVYYFQNSESGGSTQANWNPYPSPISVHFTNSSLGLQLFLSTSSEFNKPGETFAINLTEFNFENNSNQVSRQNDWVLPGLSFTPCFTDYPFELSIFRGNYSMKDISSLKQKTALALTEPGDEWADVVTTRFVID